MGFTPTSPVLQRPGRCSALTDRVWAHLLHSTTPEPLSWRHRLRVILEAAEALVFLHTAVAGGKGTILHRDFKPENILLDENLHAYLADTG